MSKLLVINADDFGMTDAITDGICRAARAGALTSTTLVAAGGPKAIRALELADGISSLGVGIHLNLTHGHCTADPAEVSDLVDADGRFIHKGTGLLRRSSDAGFRDQVRAEWAAQIEWFLATGRRPTHLDSHKHVHAAPRLFRVACELADRYEVPFIRRPMEVLWRAPWARPGPPLKWFRRCRQWTSAVALRMLSGRSTRRTLARSRVRSTDRFYGIADTGGWSVTMVRRLVSRLRPGLSELMVHPGLFDSDAPGRLGRSHPMELACLLESDLPALAREHGVRLVNFRQLG
ncbi:MAG: Chitooligosaccharide deacetylase [Phycisphaerae bacterium]|nr:Chitooligosaccharide deacetylase [Phycisphaerae bacterium]